MTRMLRLIMLLALVATPSTLQSAPISDGSLAPIKAGWFRSHGVSCPQICAAVSAFPEEDRFAGPSISQRHSYTCKAYLQAPGVWGAQGYIFGSTFDLPGRQGQCVIASTTGAAVSALDFMCLCVAPL